ncbi:MAG TPA: transglutaminase-like domain-containing protein [Candidatus Acidoferrales bacterium]|nr:transglutaminase-like domain-containing protein [Candidatus Acidoferrales bacterium]
MANDDNSVLAYYAKSGFMTDPGRHAAAFGAMPRDIAALCEIVQGLLLHIFWAPAYGFKPPTEREDEVQLRSVAEMLDRALVIDPQALTVARPPARRLLGNCRHFSTLVCAILRHQGVPARARCGFGAYFNRGTFEDHWVCEYWNHRQGRWTLVDAQLDAKQRQILNLPFDPLDVPRDQFIVAGRGWTACRRGESDPMLYGIFDMRGLWFIRGNVVRDIASLNRVELLPWDGWGLMAKKDSESGAEDTALLDRCAALSTSGNEAFGDLRQIYEDPRLRVPRVIDSFRLNGVEKIELPGI